MNKRLVKSLWGLLWLPCALAQTTHFHHAHLNSTDPQGAMSWYIEHLSGERAKLGAEDAIWTQQSWLLFNKVKQPPPYDIVSPLFHIGWGAEDMKAEFERQIKLGTTFSVALTDAVELFGAGQRDRNFFMYLYGPDHVTIEVQSANHHNFMHVHMLSDDPVAAADWYVKHLGLVPRNSSAAVRAYRGIPTGPLGGASLDAVTFFWYPTSHAKALYGGEWKGRTQYATNRGRVLDHIAFSVDNLDQTVARLKSEGVPVIGTPKMEKGLRSVFIKGPDNAEIEIVEGHPKR